MDEVEVIRVETARPFQTEDGDIGFEFAPFQGPTIRVLFPRTELAFLRELFAELDRIVREGEH